MIKDLRSLGGNWTCERIGAHRYAIDYWGSQCVLHSCHNPACVRPSHLRVGTVKENNQDTSRAGNVVNQFGAQTKCHC